MCYSIEAHVLDVQAIIKLASVPLPRSPKTPLLCLDLGILLHVDVLVGLENADFVIGEFDGEALDQSELMLDLSAIGLGLLLGLVEFVGRSILFEGDVVERHLAGGSGGETMEPN